jgi:energy-coupling factor transporter transmembrane protein EcfT
MINSIEKYYQNKLSNRTLVFSHMKYWRVILISLIFIIILSVILLDSFNVINSVISIGVGFLLLCIFNWKAKLVIKTQYKLPQKEILWGGEVLEHYKEKQLKEFLESNFNDNLKDRLKMVIDHLQKQISKNKVKEFFLPGVFIALGIPVWLEYVKWHFSRNLTINDGTHILFDLLIMVIFITYMYSMTRVMVLDLFSIKNSRYREMVEKLERIMIDVSK